MNKLFSEPVKLSLYHNQIKLKRGPDTIKTDPHTLAIAAGVQTRTINRWAAGTQQPPESALRLFAVMFFGVMPWPEWEPFNVHYGRDQNNAQRWLICHKQILQWWTPERLLMLAHGYDKAREMERQRDTLQAAVTALSTRQPPPLPCAEIIPLAYYQDTKKGPA